MTTTAIKNGLGTTFRFLNQPLIKEGVKNIASAAAFTFGIIEAYDIYQIIRGRDICPSTNGPKWVQVATKIILICAKLSLILSAATSRPGVFIISTIAGSIFSTGQLERLFGPNTVFALNPYHPRHILSIAAVILALPSLIQSTCTGIHWAYNKLAHSESHLWLTDTKVHMMTLFNTLTSRPIQHLGNQLCRTALH